VVLLDAESGELRLRLVGHHRSVNDISWSPDESKLDSSADDSSCKVWGSSTGALLRTIQPEGHCFSLSRAMAFAMGHHPRRGGGSRVLELEVGVVRMVVDLA